MAKVKLAVRLSEADGAVTIKPRRASVTPAASQRALNAVDGSLSIRPAQSNRQAFALELTAARSGMPLSEPVMEALRGGARY